RNNATATAERWTQSRCFLMNVAMSTLRAGREAVISTSTTVHGRENTTNMKCRIRNSVKSLVRNLKKLRVVAKCSMKVLAFETRTVSTQLVIRESLGRV